MQRGRRLGHLQPGDIVRWNRLEVRKDYDYEEFTLGEKQRQVTRDNHAGDVSAAAGTADDDHHHHPLLGVICDLSSSWRDPAVGPSMARLCRIVPDDESSRGRSGMRRKQHPPSNEYDLEWEDAISPSMDVLKDIVRGLAN